MSVLVFLKKQIVDMCLRARGGVREGREGRLEREGAGREGRDRERCAQQVVLSQYFHFFSDTVAAAHRTLLTSFTEAVNKKNFFKPLPFFFVCFYCYNYCSCECIWKRAHWILTITHFSYLCPCNISTKYSNME